MPSVTAPTTATMPFPEEQSGWWPSEKTAKSRLRAIFTRTKSDNKIPQYMSTSDYIQTEIQSISTSNLTSTNPTPITKRNRSTTWTNRNPRQSSRTLKDNSTRNMTSRDPPPLFQACLQARLSEVLEVPSTLTEVLFRTSQRRRNSISGESSSRSSFADDESIGSAKHKRNWSGASSCSMTQKLFVLLRNGFVLQYSADGLNDRLPEKILELGPRSVAFASDAIPGKHWVLRISHDRHSSAVPSHASKHSWSKFGFRQQENKRLVQDLLLVFDNAIVLDSWLTAVRKEIELLGGLEYRPDSRSEDHKQEARRSLKAQKSLPNISQASLQLSSNYLFKELPPSPKLLPPMPKWSAPRNVSRSTTDSSIHTLNDLDDLRDSSFSDTRSVSTSCTSIASRSPAVESFSPSASVYQGTQTPASTTSRLSTPTQDDVGELSMFMATPRKNSTSETLVPRPLRTRAYSGSVPTSHHPDVIDHALFVQPTKHLETGSTDMGSRPISVIAPLPEPGHLRKVSARYRYEAQGTTVHPNTPNSSRPSSVRSRSSSSVTQLDSPIDLPNRRTPSYSLFPKRYSSLEDPVHVCSLSDVQSPPSVTPGNARDSSGSSFPFSRTSDDQSEARSSLTSNRSVRRKVGRVASVDSNSEVQTDSPPRSPAVTEALLQSCFGTASVRRPAQAQPVLVNSKETSIETTMLEVSASIARASQGVMLSNPPRRVGHVKGQKSMPSLVGSMPPSGPPPTGPLPALPTEALSAGAKMRKGSRSISNTPLPLRAPSPNAPKHMHAESSPSSLTTTAPSPVSLCSPAPAASSTQSVTHTRKTSSISSVGSVRHVTAWLASPKIAAFSAKYDLDATPQLNVDIEDQSFSSSFGSLMH
ncbi:hypothetical protein B0A52_04735 [Exophiala mesophila]|uniref:PH domain-containing protein n=1 Tax=Exophiala mesophila TaxID=212818 RepID=A0A438N8N6_EXOME|nr:hypothetical protein B0A52_04735 [Exophiala mesophila]